MLGNSVFEVNNQGRITKEEGEDRYWEAYQQLDLDIPEGLILKPCLSHPIYTIFRQTHPYPWLLIYHVTHGLQTHLFSVFHVPFEQSFFDRLGHSYVHNLVQSQDSENIT